jgi:hypothetical protein
VHDNPFRDGNLTVAPPGAGARFAKCAGSDRGSGIIAREGEFVNRVHGKTLNMRDIVAVDKGKREVYYLPVQALVSKFPVPTRFGKESL